MNNIKSIRGGVTALLLFLCTISYGIEISKTQNVILTSKVYDHLAYNRFFECFNSVVTGIDIQLRRKEDTNIYLVNGLSKSKEKVFTIKADDIIPEKMQYHALGTIEIGINEFLAIDGNLFYGTDIDKNNVPGAEFLQDDGKWSSINEKLGFAYSLYYYFPEENKIGKSFSIMANSIGTDNFVTRVNRHYIQRMQTAMGMSLFGRATKGGATVIYDLLKDHNSFTAESRIHSLYSEKGQQPDFIFVAGGINDFLTNETYGSKNFIRNAEIGTWVDDFGSLRNDGTFYEAYEYLMFQLKELYPKSKIVCLTPMKTYTTKGCDSHDPFINDYGINLEDFVNAEKDICNRMNIDVIDMFTLFPINQDNKYEITVDCLHPNDTGYAFIEKAIWDYLKQEKNSTGIRPVIKNKENNNGKIYNLNGIMTNKKEGIYIVNRKKYIRN